MGLPITEDWLRAVGFKWHQLSRQPDRHWVLWLGDAIAGGDGCDSLGLELAPSNDGTWFCWLRSDLAGRYHRFVHVRHMREQGEIEALVSALTGLPWAPQQHFYGSVRTPEQADRIRREHNRLDRVLARERPWSATERDDSIGRPLHEHLEAHEEPKRKP